MKNVAELFHGDKNHPDHNGRYFGPATILAVDQTGVKLKLTGAAPVLATALVAVGMAPQTGDRVLVAGENTLQLYVIGILERNPAHESHTIRIDASDGACAVIDESAGTQKLQVFSKNRKMLFEYDTENGRARVMLETGDLTLQTKTGDIALESHRNIRLKADRIEMQSRLGAEISAGDPSRKLQPRVTLDPERLHLSGNRMGISADTGDLRFGALGLKSEKVSGELSHVRLAMKRLETIADTVIGKAKSVYRHVAEITELKTGRLRTLVRGTWHTTSAQAVLKSEKAFKVKSDKIHLG